MFRGNVAAQEILAGRGSAADDRQKLHEKDDYPDMANLLGKRNRGLGVSVIAITPVIGTTAFLSMIATGVSPLVRIFVGLISVLASVMASLQTFLRYAERAEEHRAAGARYGAIRRRLEAIYARAPEARRGIRLRRDSRGTRSSRARSPECADSRIHQDPAGFVGGRTDRHRVNGQRSARFISTRTCTLAPAANASRL